MTDTGIELMERDDERTPMITPSEIIEHLYCPRFTYFMNCLGISQHEEKRYKVMKGREFHEKREAENREYLRKKLGCVAREIAVYLASPALRVRGIIDEVLTLADGTMAPLDYKHSEFNERTYSTFKIQSVLYARLIMDRYQEPVERGFICYCREGFKVKEIVYRKRDFVYAEMVVKEIFRVMLNGYYPKRTKWRSRCPDCCYRNICA
ncbi:MAG: CRISPR-associated protein Cas4 [Candidatus Wallbacteria bacterium]|nr:CRISPR-associated protein Cas4 [Candidatus Wallbacteria bacterium]